jgi:hypothetical protein
MRHPFLDPSHHDHDWGFRGERLIAERGEAEGKCDWQAGEDETSHDADEEDQKIKIAEVFQRGLQQIKPADDERAGSHGAGGVAPASRLDQSDQADCHHDREADRQCRGTPGVRNLHRRRRDRDLVRRELICRR